MSYFFRLIHEGISIEVAIAKIPIFVTQSNIGEPAFKSPGNQKKLIRNDSSHTVFVKLQISFSYVKHVTFTMSSRLLPIIGFAYYRDGRFTRKSDNTEMETKDDLIVTAFPLSNHTNNVKIVIPECFMMMKLSVLRRRIEEYIITQCFYALN